MTETANPRVHAEILPAMAAIATQTNKILAIGSVTAKGTPDAIAPVLPFEVRATVRNYLAGKIDQWFFQTEGYGVVFIMNATSRAEAHAILEQLPLGVAGMMEFELIAPGAAGTARHAGRRAAAPLSRQAEPREGWARPPLPRREPQARRRRRLGADRDGSRSSISLGTTCQKWSLLEVEVAQEALGQRALGHGLSARSAAR